MNSCELYRLQWVILFMWYLIRHFRYDFKAKKIECVVVNLFCCELNVFVY
jgi:hypothetical protein